MTANRQRHRRPPHWEASLLVLLAVWAVPPTAQACHPVRICPKWPTNSDDSGQGEDYLADPQRVPARGVRVVITPPPPENPTAGWLDGDGCIDITTQYAYGTKMTVYAEALLGQENNIHIRAYDESAVTELDANNPDFTLDTSQSYHYDIDLHGLASGDEVEVPLPNTPTTSMLAYAAQTIYRIDEQLGAHVSGAQTIHIIPRAVDNARLNIDYGGVEIGENVQEKKFVVAHELGHWFAWKWGGLGANSYDYTPSDTPCQLPMAAIDGADSGLHALRSAEYSSGALTEGLAHFIAAAAFNDIEEDGVFTYYKAINPAIASDYQDLVDANYAVSLQGGTGALGGTSRWVANMCPNDWNWPLSGANGSPTGDEVSSEIDWMRFFWAFVASQQAGLGSQASVPDVLDILAAATWSSVTVWPPLVDAVSNHPDPAVSTHATRFQALNNTNGVFNDG